MTTMANNSCSKRSSSTSRSSSSKRVRLPGGDSIELVSETNMLSTCMHHSTPSVWRLFEHATSVDPTVVSLMIESNKNIRSLSSLNNLLSLKLHDTWVSTISDCNMLAHLVIVSNDKIKSIESLPKLQELECRSCPHLRTIVVPKVEEVKIVNCNIQRLSASMANSIILQDCYSIHNLYLGRFLRYLEINNCIYLDSLLNLSHLELDTLHLSNCPFLSLEDTYIKAKFMILYRCNKIEKIDKGIESERLVIDACTSLTSITNLKVNMCEISRCSLLRTISNNTIKVCRVEYCNSLVLFDTSNISQLTLQWCFSIVRIIISQQVKLISIIDCVSMRYIRTQLTEQDENIHQSLMIKGRSAITKLQDLCLSSITLQSCSKIKEIQTMQGINDLVIEDCEDLESICNFIVSNSFYVKNCHSLIRISDIVAPKSIILLNLGDLEVVQFLFAPVTTLNIDGCESIKSCKIDGKWLESLILVDTGIINIKHLNPSSSVVINNSKYLEDIESDYATSLIAKLEERSFAIYKIISKIRRHCIRKLRNRIRDAINEHECSICLQEIEIQNRFITKCFHSFHINCIYTWCSRYANDCPMCKQTSIIIGFNPNTYNLTSA